MKNFEGFGLSDALNKSLSKMNYTEPTPIQAQAIPLALLGRDILGSAQTGTGKTAAFGIPLVEALLRSPRGTALVLTPTRELAKQVLEVIHQLLGYQSPIKTAFIIGGESMGKQFSQLRAQPRIIVGTPGRINDHLQRGSLKLHDTGFLVLDETDRMLDMGFGVQIDAILKYMPQKRQTLLFSATIPDGIVKMSSRYLTNPERISMGATNVIATNIKQEIIRIEQDKKYAELTTQLHERNGSVIIFIKTKHGAERMAKNLRRDGFEADALHGDLRQNKRTSVMNNFRNKKFRILVATDIAARGLDVPHIEHVINYDLPQVAEDYIHRMGRTARAGASGSALSFVASQENRKWYAIEVLLGIAGDGGTFGGKKRVPGAFGGNGKKKKKSGERPRRSRRRDNNFQDNNRDNNRDDNRGNNKSAKPGGFKGKPKFAENKSEGYKGKSEGYKGKPKFAEGGSEGYKGKPRSTEGRSEGYKGNKPKSAEGRSSEGYKGKSEGYKGKPKFAGGKSEGFKSKPHRKKHSGDQKPSGHSSGGHNAGGHNNPGGHNPRKRPRKAA